MSHLKFGDQNCTACSRCGRTRDLYNGRISSLFLYLKLLAMNPITLFAVLQLFSVFATWGLWWWWFQDPTVDLLSASVDWTCYSCFACCCVRCASQNIYLHWNSCGACFFARGAWEVLQQNNTLKYICLLMIWLILYFLTYFINFHLLLIHN